MQLMKNLRWLMRLTLTWDVFKYTIEQTVHKAIVRLTLTWDVFKSFFYTNTTTTWSRLTLTWDVFKWQWLGSV